MPVHSVTEMKVKVSAKKGNGPHNADPRSQGGTVDFIADAPCLLIFSNPEVFGTRCTELQTGSNVLPVEVENGRTTFEVHDIPPALSKSGSSPNDIVVP